MGILVAHFTIYLISSFVDQNNNTHPSNEDRLEKAIMDIEENISDEVQAYIIAAFMALNIITDVKVPYDKFSVVSKARKVLST